MNLLFPVWKFPHPGTIGTSMQVEITHLFLKLLIPIIQKYLWRMQIALPRSAEVASRSRHNALRDRFLLFFCK